MNSASVTGTYNPSTGTYTSASGATQSRANAPKGATIVGGTAFGSSYGGGSSYAAKTEAQRVAAAQAQQQEAQRIYAEQQKQEQARQEAIKAEQARVAQIAAEKFKANVAKASNQRTDNLTAYQLQTSEGSSGTTLRLQEKIVDYYNAPDGNKVPMTKVYVVDDKGNNIRAATDTEIENAGGKNGSLPRTLQATTLNQFQQGTKPELTSKSFVYQIVPAAGYYAGYYLRKGLSKIPLIKDLIHDPDEYPSLKSDLPIIATDNPFILEGGKLAQGFSSAAPLAAFDIVNIVNKPFIKQVSAGEASSTFIERQAYLRTPDDDLKLVSKYDIRTTITPPTQRLTTTFREWVDEPMLEQPVGKAKTILTKTPFISEVGKDFPVFEVTSKQKSVSIISGNMEDPINLLAKYPNKLTKIDLRLAQELLGNVPEELRIKMIPKEADFTYGDIKSVKYYKGARTTDLDIAELKRGYQPEGRRTIRTRYLTKIEDISDMELPYETFKSKAVFKDVTLPIARSSGKIYEMTGVIFRKREPIQIFKELDLDKFDFNPIDLKANLPKVEVVKQEVIQQNKLIQLPKAIPNAVKRLINVENAEKAITKPIKSGTISVPASLVLSESKSLNYPSIENRLKEFASIRDEEITKQQPRLIEKTKEKLLNKEIEKEMFKTRSLPKQIERQQPRLIEKTLQKQQEKLMQKLIEKPLFKTPTPPFRPPVSYYSYGKIFPPMPKGSNKFNKRLKRLLGFDVFKIFKGKPQVVARGLSKESALDIGAKEVLGNLRASFFLRKSNLPARELSTSNEFGRYRKAFREPVLRSKYRKYGEVFIQKSTKVPGLSTGRLTTKSERMEIQAYRRRKKNMERYLQ